MVARSSLKEAVVEDVPTIVRLLEQMQDEVNEFVFDPVVTQQSVARSLNEDVYWFLFQDEAGYTFGTCHLQSVHNYWRLGRRYYLGGMYIEPTYRGQGRFRDIYQQLQAWATDHGGVQIYGHIHEENEKSLGVFASVGMDAKDYALCINHWGK